MLLHSEIMTISSYSPLDSLFSQGIPYVRGYNSKLKPSS